MISRFIKLTLQAALLSSLFFSCCTQKHSTKENQIPDWLKKEISSFESVDVKNSPGQIQSFKYNSNLVYYVSQPACCDQYSALYDESGNIICHPDGGITGKGDGKCSDFFELRAEMKVIWLDERLTQ